MISLLPQVTPCSPSGGNFLECQVTVYEAVYPWIISTPFDRTSYRLDRPGRESVGVCEAPLVVGDNGRAVRVFLGIKEYEETFFKPIGYPVYSSKQVVAPYLLKRLSLEVFPVGLFETAHLIGYLIVPIFVRRRGTYQVLMIWVFVFPNHVVAECPTHGNAIYIIKVTSDWRNLLNRSKADLLKGFPDRVVRIIHRRDRQSRLNRIIKT